MKQTKLMALLTVFILLSPLSNAGESQMLPLTDKVLEFKNESDAAFRKSSSTADLFSKGFSSEELSRVYEYVESRNKWDFDERPNGMLYYLDTAYGDPSKGEYLSLTIIQKKLQKRPVRISFVVASSVVQDRGIYISFCNLKVLSKEIKSLCDADKSFVINFSSCDRDTCTAHIDNLILKSEGGKTVDIFDLVMTHNLIGYAFFTQNNHTHFSASLNGFHKKYKEYTKQK